MNAETPKATSAVGGFAGNVGNSGNITFKNCLTFSKVETAPTANVGGFIGHNAQTAENIALSTYTDCAWVLNNTAAVTDFGSASPAGAEHAGISPIGITPKSIDGLNIGSGAQTLTASEAGGYKFDKWIQLNGADYVTRTGYEYDLTTSVSAKKADGMSTIGGTFKRVNYPDVAVSVPIKTGTGIVSIATWDDFVNKVKSGGQFVQTANISAPAGITAYQAKEFLGGSYDGAGYTINVGAIPQGAYRADANGNIGLFGEVSGNISSLAVSGMNLSSDAANTGGLAGKISTPAIISNIRVNGNIASVGANTGLLAGIIGDGVTVIGSSVSGKLAASGNGNFGGYAGSIGKASVSYGYSFVEFSQSVTKGGAYAGTIDAAANVVDGIWSSNLSGKATAAVGGAASVPAGIRKISITPQSLNMAMGGGAVIEMSESAQTLTSLGLSFENWTGDNAIRILDANSPKTDIFAGTTEGNSVVKLHLKDAKTSTSFDVGSIPITISGAIKINNLSDLKKIGVDVAYPLSGTYVQTANITISEDFTPLGNFTGIYNGGAKSITFNGKIMGGGLFSAITGTDVLPAQVNDLAIVANNTVIAGTATSAGLLAGEIVNANLNGVKVSGAISTTSDVLTELGAISGKITGGTVKNSGSSANLSINSAVARASFAMGGLFGRMTSVQETTDCYVGGTVVPNAKVTAEGNKFAGGFAGKISGAAGSISNSIIGAKVGGDAMSAANIGAFMGSDDSSITYSNNLWSTITCRPAQAFGTTKTGTVQTITLIPNGIFRKTGGTVAVAAPLEHVMLKFNEWTSEIVQGSIALTIQSPALANTNVVLGDAAGTAKLQAAYACKMDEAVKIAYSMEAVIAADSTPPVIAFTQEGIEDQKIRVRFTVKEAEAGASGVAVESVKYGIVPNDRNAQAVTNFTLDADAGKSG
ncbi:MAG: hypothetical protein RR459_07925, partial [Christensenellaceae bacterium]